MLMVMTTMPNDPGLDVRVRAAILDQVAAGQSIPDATRTVGEGMLAEVRGQGWGPRELLFVSVHVSRLGAELLARFGGLAAA